MKRLRTPLVILAAAMLALALLVWFMPARWALLLMSSRLHGVRLEQVGGTLWQGRAGQVLSADGTNWGSLDWTLSHRALIGDVQLGLDLRQPRLHGQAHVHRISDTQQDWYDVVLQVDLAMLGEQPLLHGQPLGQLDVQVSQAHWQGNWPMQMDAAGSLSQVAIRTAQDTIALGTAHFAIGAQAGVLKGTLDDDGSGPLQTAGRLTLSPLGWDVQLDLRPRGHDPALSRWLRSFGASAADGSVQLRYRGGLAQIHTTGHP
jgi:general secretion pathway protein N